MITVHDIGFKYRLQTSGFIAAFLLEVMAVIGHLFAHHIIFVSKSAKSKNWLAHINSSSTIISNGLGAPLVEDKKNIANTKLVQLAFIGNHFYVKGLDKLINYNKPISVPISLYGNVANGGTDKDIFKYEQWKRDDNIIECGHVDNVEITNFIKSGNAVLLLLST